MKSKFKIELPERRPDEPDATEKQISFIKHLLNEIEAEDFSLDIDSFGKWQASSLITRLLEIQDGECSDRISIEAPVKKRGKLVWYLILAFIVWLIWMLTK